jgi:tRNA A-37 threonylcarbamoyl transferase component Bud32
MTMPGFSLSEQPIVDCPENGVLRDFISLSLEEFDSARIRQHVLSCGMCQLRLENWHESGCDLVHRDVPLTGSEYSWDLKSVARIVQGLCKAISVDDSEKNTRDQTIVFEKPTDPLAIGKLSDYSIRRELASGATATVFEAIDTKTNLHVAIKFIRSKEPQTLKRVQREARALANVNHPNVISVQRVEKTDDGRIYLVMPLALGSPLSELLLEQRLDSFETIVQIVIQIAQGLHAVHHHGMLHRDIKPSNIVVSSSGFAQLTDLGLVAFIDEDSSLTGTDMVVGTPAYMSPEQAKSSQHLDARSDIYSLGATLYECLTETKPFRGRPHQIIRQILNDEPTYLDQSIGSTSVRSDLLESDEQESGLPIHDCGNVP